MDLNFIRIRIGDDDRPGTKLDRFVHGGWSAFFFALILVGAWALAHAFGLV